MKINGCTTYLVALPNRRHHTWASKMVAPIGYHVIVRLDTDEGISGWGESPAGITWGGSHMRYYGESPESVQLIIEKHLKDIVIGMDPRDIGLIHHKMDKAVKGLLRYCRKGSGRACIQTPRWGIQRSHRSGPFFRNNDRRKMCR